VNNTGTKYVRFMKQTAFWRERNGKYIPCLKYSVLTKFYNSHRQKPLPNHRSYPQYAFFG